MNAIKEGWLKIQIEHVFNLEDAHKTQPLLENRQTVGKIVLNID